MIQAGTKCPAIDIHCHILPDVDDGPLTLEISLAMAKIAAKDGTGIIIATPHTDGIRVTRDIVKVLVNRLNQELHRQNITIEVLGGFEIPYHMINALAPTHTLGSSNSVLIEFPPAFVPGDAETTLHRLLDKGLQPVIAHPERNLEILANPERLGDLIAAGAQAQLTAASITGDLGPDIRQCSYHLLQKKMVHFIATDSHSPSFREPVLSKAHKIVTKLLDREQADLMTIHNPAKIACPTMTNNPETDR